MGKPGKQNTANFSQDAIGGEGVRVGGVGTAAVTVGSANGKAIRHLSAPGSADATTITLSKLMLIQTNKTC